MKSANGEPSGAADGHPKRRTCLKAAHVASVAIALGAMTSAPTRMAYAESADGPPPVVFQAAGPTPQSILSTVDAFRAALGVTNNGSNPGPLDSGHREINWDGGGANNTTSPPVTPFDVFLNSRGAQFTTRGTGLTQAPPAGGPDGGLAQLFNNPTYGTIFKTFSPPRLFGTVGSNVMDALFFIPGTNGGTAARVNGFGVVFTDVDQPSGRGKANGLATQIRVFGADGKLVFRGSAPAAPGDGTL